MSNYTTKLLDPRWQKKRLEILERDKWQCQLCQSTTNTLNVHHKDYLPSTDPWDYPSDLLITLCQDCHEAELEGQSEVEQSIIHQLKRNFMSLDLAIISDGLQQVKGLTITEAYMFSEIIRWLCTDNTIRNELDRRCWEAMHTQVNNAKRR